MRARMVGAAVAATFALGAVGCSDIDTDGSSGPSAPMGGYDDGGYPLDETGEVSTDPEDHREAVCESGLVDDLPDFEEECK